MLPTEKHVMGGDFGEDLDESRPEGRRRDGRHVETVEVVPQLDPRTRKVRVADKVIVAALDACADGRPAEAEGGARTLQVLPSQSLRCRLGKDRIRYARGA